MSAYYNEYDKYAAAWLRNLIAAGHLPAGEVDERSIADVKPDDLAGFTQCHFFAGIGGWSHALRLAGWDDARPVWTGSAPCQPFSAAGRQQGAADARHLWPEMFRLVRECRPAIVFGEQVEAAVRHGWLDGVFGDLEGEGYACGAHVLGAHSVGAPHIRQRLFWVADAENANGRRGERAAQAGIGQDGERGRGLGERGLAGWLADAEHAERWAINGPVEDERNRHDAGRQEAHGIAGTRRQICDTAGGMGDAEGARSSPGGAGTVFGEPSGASRASSFWSAADWLPCTDGKARRVEPGTFPLAHGVPNRVGRLRAYGNAIVPQVAAEFIKCAAAETPE